MPTLSITRSYSSGNILTEAQLDNIRNGLHTFFNTTKLDSTNVDLQSVVDQASDIESGVLLQKRGLGSTLSGELSGSQVLTTTYADVVSVTVTDPGTYLITAMGKTTISRGSTTAATSLSALLYARIFNGVSSTAIGPEISSINECLFSSAIFLDRVFAYPISFSYIAALSASDTVKLQSRRDTDVGGTASTIGPVWLDLVRLKI